MANTAKTVSGRRTRGNKPFLFKLATFLATGPLREAHGGTGIAWLFAHTRNFCYRRLADGHDTTTIKAHYLAALAEVAARAPRRRYASAVVIVAYNSLGAKKISP